jgi:hypothetical protein
MDVSGADLNEIAAAVNSINNNKSLGTKFRPPFVEKTNNSVHIGIISADTGDIVKLRRRSIASIRLAEDGGKKDWFEGKQQFIDKGKDTKFSIHNVDYFEAENIAHSDPEAFFYRGLHQRYPNLEVSALRGVVAKNAKFFFIFKYHEREEKEFVDLLKKAAELLSQQDARAFFYYHLHHKFPELGRGAIIQLINTNPESYHEFGLEKDYPDYLEAANNAINIEDPSRTKVIVVEETEDA